MKYRLRCVAGFLAAAFTVAGAVLADLPLVGNSIYLLVAGIIEGPDPIPMFLWDVVDPPRGALTPGGAGSGYAAGDGRPDLTFVPTTGWPVAVWAYDRGSDHDIALCAWNGASWTDPEFLTSSTADEVDPRVFVDGTGAVHVVWWVAGSTQLVYLKSRSAPTVSWQPAVLVNAAGPSGRRPSVAVWGGLLHVAYERTRGSGQEIVLARRALNGSWTLEPVLGISRTQPLDPLLHVEQGVVWLDYKANPATLAWVRRSGTSWTGPTNVAWVDPTWLGELAARDDARRMVFGL